MTVTDAFPAVDAILADHAQTMGGDRAAYRNHVTRIPEMDAEVRTLIHEHHKLGRYDQQFAATVETFRRADLVDLSLGAIRSGLSREFVRSVRRALPNAGFHRRLVALSLRQFVRSPWRPLPMFHARQPRT